MTVKANAFKEIETILKLVGLAHSRGDGEGGIFNRCRREEDEGGKRKVKGRRKLQQGVEDRHITRERKAHFADVGCSHLLQCCVMPDLLFRGKVESCTPAIEIAVGLSIGPFAWMTPDVLE